MQHGTFYDKRVRSKATHTGGGFIPFDLEPFAHKLLADSNQIILNGLVVLVLVFAFKNSAIGPIFARVGIIDIIGGSHVQGGLSALLRAFGDKIKRGIDGKQSCLVKEAFSQISCQTCSYHTGMDSLK